MARRRTRREPVAQQLLTMREAELDALSQHVAQRALQTVESHEQRNLNFARAYGRGPQPMRQVVEGDYSSIEQHLLQHYAREDELTVRALYRQGAEKMNLIRMQLKPGDLFVSEGGQRLSFLRERESGEYVFIVMDPHEIEGLKYPAGARWCFSGTGEFLWETPEGRSTEVPGLNIARKWTAEDQARREKLLEDAFEAEQNDVRPVQLEERMPLPEPPPEAEKKPLGQRLLKALRGK